MNDRLSFERSSLERPSERSSFDRGSSFDQQQDRVRISITESDRPRASFAFESRLLPLVVESVRDSSVWWWILQDECGLTRLPGRVGFARRVSAARAPAPPPVCVSATPFVMKPRAQDCRRRSISQAFLRPPSGCVFASR